jgi:hypothetical protein
MQKENHICPCFLLWVRVRRENPVTKTPLQVSKTRQEEEKLLEKQRAELSAESQKKMKSKEEELRGDAEKERQLKEKEVKERLAKQREVRHTFVCEFVMCNGVLDALIFGLDVSARVYAHA